MVDNGTLIPLENALGVPIQEYYVNQPVDADISPTIRIHFEVSSSQARLIL